MPIEMPAGVSCVISSDKVTVKGPLGEDTCDLMTGISVTQDTSVLNVVITDTAREVELGAAHGLIRSLLANVVTGVSKGFERDLEIQGVGFRVAQSGDDLQFHLGFSHQVIFKTRPGITLKAIDPTHIKVSGYNKQVVGQVAADIRGLKKPEPYKGKGIRYAKENVRRKAGKTGKK